MRHIVLAGILLIAFSLTAKAQVSYSGKIMVGYLNFLLHNIQVDPGPNWKGYNLNEEQNGIDINLINGITLFKKRAFVGIGLNYRLKEKISIFIKSGLILTQQSLLVPIQFGVRF